jgi:NADPH-dependent glutamate synthase beta subunit-like oxidoreductase
MRTNIPAFRLPQQVLSDEIRMVLDMGVDLKLNHTIESLRELVCDGRYDAVFVGSGAPHGKELKLPGRSEGVANIHIGIAWLGAVAFGHTEKIGARVLIIGVGNTAMDCCRTSLRLGAQRVKVMARKPRSFFKASAWELEDAEEEHVEIIVNRVPKSFVVADGRLTGMLFDKMEYDFDADGRITAERIVSEEFEAADDVILAIGQENAFPWIERDLGIEFDKWNVPVVDAKTFQSTRAGVFFGGDAAFGPKNIIWAVEQAHQAAISIHKHCHGESINVRLAPGVSLQSRKMGMHEWSYANDYNSLERRLMPHVSLKERFKKLDIEVELGFTAEQVAAEAQRCLNCDVQTVFDAKLCIECDACIDICPVDCLTITANAEEAVLRTHLKAPALNTTQALYVSRALPQTGRVMVKDEDVCVHCGLCAERCPTAAWDMQKSYVHWPLAVDEARAAAEREPKIA